MCFSSYKYYDSQKLDNKVKSYATHYNTFPEARVSDNYLSNYSWEITIKKKNYYYYFGVFASYNNQIRALKAKHNIYRVGNIFIPTSTGSSNWAHCYVCYGLCGVSSDAWQFIKVSPLYRRYHSIKFVIKTIILR